MSHFHSFNFIKLFIQCGKYRTHIRQCFRDLWDGITETLLWSSNAHIFTNICTKSPTHTHLRTHPTRFMWDCLVYDWLCTRLTGGQQPFGRTSIIICNLVTLSALVLKQDGIGLTTTEVHVCFGLLIRPAMVISIHRHFISDMHSCRDHCLRGASGLPSFSHKTTSKYPSWFSSLTGFMFKIWILHFFKS